MKFLELFNKVAKAVRPAHHDYADITVMNEPIGNSGLDSMDGLMIGIYMAEIYGIPEEIAKEMQPKTVQDYLDFINKHKTKDPKGSADDIVSGVNW